MAVDANVLVFERAKDEHEAGRSVRSASVAGFRRAWSAIADSNATTLLAAVLLFFFASGAVRGFGITLSVGVVVSMFSALVVTRVLVELVLRSRRLLAAPGALGLAVGGRLRVWLAERGPDLLGRRRLWFAISAGVLAVAVAGIGARGLSYGLEFSGAASSSTPRSARPTSPPCAKSWPTAACRAPWCRSRATGTSRCGPGSSRAPRSGTWRRPCGARAGTCRRFATSSWGPTIGDELRRKAFIALAVALAAQLAYLAVRFRWTYATAAVAAMFHDVTILLGVFAWLGKELDGVFLAALLTVIGYSINDSVVVFDRIREQRRTRLGESLARVANDACLQTIPRTVNTGLGALFILVALYFLGGETLTDFALALLIGIVVGTYSSIFTAAPLAVALERAGPVPPARAAPPLEPRGGGSGGDKLADKPDAGQSRPSTRVLVPARSRHPVPRPRKNRRRGGRRR